METLIPMTDFVLEQRMTKDQIDDASYLEIQNHINNYYSKVFNYANFLKKPLKLGYFVPSDENDEALPRPSLYDPRSKTGLYDIDEYDERVKEYKEAEAFVLFKFEPYFDIGVIEHHISQKRNIEYLANFGSVKLTETAKKEIGLI